jgi:Protein of unknown function (DUF4058)
MTYLEVLKRGPFPDHTDPWAESGTYFQQLHAAIIGEIFSQIADPLLEKGYVTRAESSLQVFAGFKSDLEAIHIRGRGGKRLITVIEIVSPRNKDHLSDVESYQKYRQYSYLDRGVNVVEIDLTRSQRRLSEQTQQYESAYQVVVFLPGMFIPRNEIRFIDMPYGQGLKRVALPLDYEVVPIDLPQVYKAAYEERIIAAQLEDDQQYEETKLPYPSLLSEKQRQEAVESVHNWQQLVASLRPKQ